MPRSFHVPAKAVPRIGKVPRSVSVSFLDGQICNRCQFAATWNETNVPALPVLPRSITTKPSPEVGWFCYEHDGYANLPGLLARRVG